MANNRIQVKRTNVADRTANVTNSGNTQYIAAGEFALNMADGILYTSNGSALIAVGANNATISSGNSTANLFANSTFLRIANSTTSSNLTSSSLIAGISTVNTTVVAVGSNNFMNATALDIGNTVITTTNVVFGGTIAANGGIGTLGQVLTSGAAGNAYWSTPTTGTVTSVATGNGMTGGPITSTGTVSVLANTGIVANATGVFVNATYIATIASNSATYANSSISNTFTVGTTTYFVANGNLGVGTASPEYKLHVTGNFGFFNNGIRLGAGYSAIDVATGVSGLFLSGSQGALNHQFISPTGNVGIGNTAPTHKLSVNGDVFVNTSVAVGNSTVNATVNSTIFTGTANNATYFGGYTWAAPAILGGTTANGGSFTYANVSGQVNTATLYATTSANIASAVQANATGVWTTGTVNAATLSVGTSFVANTSRVVLGTAVGFQANGGIGTAGQFLTSNGTTTYWSTGGSGTVTSVATGNGMTGGTITSSGTVSVLANTGIVANSTGVFVNATYIATIASNSATYANSSVTNTFTVGTASYFVSNGNLGIGTSTPSTKLSVNPKVIDDNSHTYDSNTVYITHQSPTATATLNDPKPVLILARQGTSGQAFGAAAEFNISRYENNSTNSRTRMDIRLADGSFLSQNTAVMTMLSNGSVGIGNTTPNAKLQVTGTANVSGNVAIAGITTLSTNVVLGTTTITANGSVGTAGQVLTSGAAGNSYWTTPTTGTVTSVATGNGMTGGPVTTTGTVSVLANTGIIANTTGTFVNATYIGTISANNASFLGTVAAASYVQNTDTRVLSGNLNFTGTNNFFSTGLFVGANVSANTTALFVGNSTVNATHNSALVQVANSTASANQTAIGFVAGISIVNTTVVQVGTNNYINATALDIGNSVMTSVLLTLGGQVNANGGVGTAGQVLTSGAAGNAYWTTVAGGSGTVTSVASGNGITGGTITATGTLVAVAGAGVVVNTSGINVLANTGIIANTTGTFVNATYIGTISANNASFLGTVAAASYVQNTDSRTLSGNLVISGTSFTPSSNTILLGNSTQRWVLSANTGSFSGAVSGITTLATGNTTITGFANVTTTIQGGSSLTIAGALSGVTTSAMGNTTITGFANVTTTIQGGSSLTIAGALSGVTTSAMGNTTITGFVNATSSVNAASYTVGTSFTANSTVVNAVSYYAGTLLVANSTVSNATHLGGVAAASYVQNTDSRVLSGNLNFTGTNNFFSTGLFVGANVIANTTALFVGNSTANSTTNTTAVTAHIQHASRPTLGFNYTIANTVNSLIVGPYQVNTGFTLTVETGARLVIA